MRKIPPDLTNPIDNLILDLIDSTDHIFYKLHFTPNMLTTISLLTGLASMYYFYYNSTAPAIILYLISYIFDCYDGHFARKYKMVSKFGDYYDHIKDITVIIIFFIIAYSKCHKLNTATCCILVTIGLVLAILMGMNFGCQEIYYNKKESPTLDSLTALCPIKTKTKHNASTMMRKLRHFGSGTFIIYILFLMYYLMWP